MKNKAAKRKRGRRDDQAATTSGTREHQSLASLTSGTEGPAGTLAASADSLGPSVETDPRTRKVDRLSHEMYLAALHEDIGQFIEAYRAARRREADLERQCGELTEEREKLLNELWSLRGEGSALQGQLDDINEILNASGLQRETTAGSVLDLVMNADQAHRELCRVYSSRSWRYTRLLRRSARVSPGVGAADNGA
jgi:chromosome segregation ATPase